MTDFITKEGLFRLMAVWLILSSLSLIFGRRFAKLTKAVLLGSLFRLMISWFVFSVLGFIYGNQLLVWSFPLLTKVINLIQDDYSGTLTIVNGHHNQQILLRAIINRSFPPFVKGNELNTIFDIAPMDFIMPEVLLFSLLCAWPVTRFQSRIKLLLLSIPLSLMVITLTVPFQLGGVNEKVFQNMSEQFNLHRDKPFMLTWLQILDNSGAWLQSIGIALLGITLMHQVQCSSASKNEPKN
jgi:hypothetical protein